MSQIREISEAFLYLFKMVSKKKIQRERIQKVFCFFYNISCWVSCATLTDYSRSKESNTSLYIFIYRNFFQSEHRTDVLKTPKSSCCMVQTLKVVQKFSSSKQRTKSALKKKHQVKRVCVSKMYLVLRQCTYIQCGCVFHVSVFITVFVCFENIKVGKKQLVSYFDTTYIVKS